MATCKNGHYYPDDVAVCPYCPKPAEPGSVSPLLRTTIVGGPDVRAGEAAEMPPPVMRTLLMEPSGAPAPAAEGNMAGNRKLMGWLVTFDRAPLGQDFQLREGRNVIGSAPDCDVCINGDPNVSARHLTLLFRLGEMLFRDELSTNGTFINGHLSNEGLLQDGDRIRIGSTHLLFRSAQTHAADESL